MLAVRQSKHTILFGNGAAMAEVRALIDRHVNTDAAVLIRGEPGTGKDLVASALAGSRLGHGNPFVKINCGALPGESLEAELFGFGRGVFTGAVRSKPGKFEMADGGTILLNEVGEISLPLQAKVLSALQRGRFSRLGEQGELRARVRVIATTSRDIDRAVLEGRFRQDLLAGLNVVSILVPPLRERRDDIPLLAEFFLRRWSVFYNRPTGVLSSTMLDECARHHWPGNVRELENMMKRTVLLGSAMLTRRHFRPERPRKPGLAADRR